MRLILRFLAFVFAVGTFAAVAGASVVGFGLWKYSQDLPDHAQLADYEPKVMTRVHAGDGSLLAEYSTERRLFLPIGATPKLVVNAFLSAEDKNFYKHGGVDPEGVVRALVLNLRGGGSRQQGASTITQQVAKNFIVGDERSLARKVREMLVAFRIEKTFSKDKILELYLNEIYLGFNNMGPNNPGSYGVAAAALNHFNKSVNELTLPEAAFLAALPKGPNNYNPITKREAATTRRNWVIDRMVDNGFVARAEGDKAKAEPLTVNLRQVSPNTYAAGFFAEEVRREIAERYGYSKLNEGGLSVRGTLDPKMQALARRTFTEGLVRYDEARGWRGADKRVPVAGDWGTALGELKEYNDIQPWRYAAVLEVTDAGARIGIQPRREGGGVLSRERQIGVIPPDGAKWTRKRLTQALNPGDAVYVEPLDAKAGTYRLRQVPEVSGGMVVMEPNTGRVLAMVGGFSFDASEFNRATQAQRQPGSSFKPIVYTAALDNGYTPSSIVLDEAVEIDQGNGEIWRPENYSGGGTGPRSLRYGIEQSKNLMTVRLARDIGMPLVADYAKRFGVYDEMLPVLAMSLGAGETTVLRMTAAYSMLANGGKRIRPTMIDRVQDRWGRTIYKHDQRTCEACAAEAWKGQDEPRLTDTREQIVDPMSAYQMVSMLEGVVQRGTAAAIRDPNRTLAGKTGTTNDAKDVWFVGFSADLAVGLYLGYDKPRSLGDSATGGQYAAPIFANFMKAALAGKPDVKFRVPPQMKLIRVAKGSGARAGSGDPAAIVEAFKPGTAPPEGYAYGGGGGGGGGGGEPATIRTGTGGLY